MLVHTSSKDKGAVRSLVSKGERRTHEENRMRGTRKQHALATEGDSSPFLIDCLTGGGEDEVDHQLLLPKMARRYQKMSTMSMNTCTAAKMWSSGEISYFLPPMIICTSTAR